MTLAKLCIKKNGVKMWLRLGGGGSQNLCHCWKQWRLRPGTYYITTFYEYCCVFFPSPSILQATGT